MTSGHGGSGLESALRARKFQDGIVVFDPVTWETRTLMPDGLELLGLIVSMIEQGERDRGRLIELLLGEMAPDAASSPLPVGIDVRSNLCPLVDLALHLNR